MSQTRMVQTRSAAPRKRQGADATVLGLLSGTLIDHNSAGHCVRHSASPGRG